MVCLVLLASTIMKTTPFHKNSKHAIKQQKHNTRQQERPGKHSISLYGGARGAAIRVLSRIDQSDSYLDKLLDKELNESEFNAMDKALLNEIVHGVTRWQAKLDWILTGFYHGEFAKCIIPVKNAMRIALYQILFLDRIPPFAAVNESVEIIKRIKGERSASVVNAVLRNILHNSASIRYPQREDDIVRYFSVVYSHPQWMVKRWIAQFGEEQTEALLQANNTRPDLSIRINTLQTSVAEFTAMLQEREVPFTLSPYDERSFSIQNLHNIHRSESFKKGWFSVQDTSATLAAKLTAPTAGMLIYDLCAAPGGKTGYMAELMNDQGTIVAIDRYEAKLRYINDMANRLHLHCISTLAADARTFQPQQLADVVLVDAPCSGTGTLSKKPDIKWKRSSDDIIGMTQLQKELLTHAASLVKPGGALVYSTCSIEPEENTEIARWFTETFPNFCIDTAEQYIPEAVCNNGFLQMFPHIHHTDGAFAARFSRTT